jgi:hypothetical protein
MMTPHSVNGLTPVFEECTAYFSLVCQDVILSLQRWKQRVPRKSGIGPNPTGCENPEDCHLSNNHCKSQFSFNGIFMHNKLVLSTFYYLQ